MMVSVKIGSIIAVATDLFGCISVPALSKVNVCNYGYCHATMQGA